MAIFKYSIWQVRNLVKNSKSIYQISLDNIFAANVRKFTYR